ncbi:putative protein TPRXL [Haliotis rufescens]|uniref:putative protein TPRXL n=1 Tax=Haliotis rufescens TaxID=6454 RepID=UPI00201EC4FF|nr:putative protein TPRXL [Haliotis rufescens]
MMARLLVLACVSFLLIACISAKKNGGAMEETGLAGLEKQQQKMVGEIETIHNAVTKLKLDMKTLLKKASKTDEAVTSINMINQLLAGAVNTGQLKSQTETNSDGSTHESTDISDDEMGTSMRPSHRQPDPNKGMSMQSAGQSSGTSGLNMFSQLFAQAMKQQGVMQAADSRPRSDGSTNESSDLSDDEMGASMRHNSQPSTSSDFSDDEMGASMRHNSQPSTSSDFSDDEMGASMRHNSQPSTSSDLSDDEMGTNMRQSHSQSAGSTRKDHFTWTLEGGLKSTTGEPVDKKDEDTDAYQLPSSGDVQTQTEGTAGQTSPDTGDDYKQS